MADQLRERVDEGIYLTHKRGCLGGSCKCAENRDKKKQKPYQATVCHRDGKLERKSFATKKEAKLWRGEYRAAIEHGSVRAPTKQTFNEAADDLLAGMRDGTIKTRSGDVYKPATIRRYELALDKHLRPELGKTKLSAIDSERVEHLLAGWWRAGMTEPSTIRNNLDPLRVIVRRAKKQKKITVDPIADQDLPTGGGRRERVADRTEAQALIDALTTDRALWATAFYGGLRRGELRALRWSDVDFEAGVIHVRRGWDDVEGEQATKSEAGERNVPLTGPLRKTLAEHKLASGRGEGDLVFGRTPTLPFTASTIGIRARTTWKAAKLKPITLHEARHTAASFLREAGLDDVELAAVIGHSDSRTTKSIYVHLFSDACEKAGAKLDAYLTNSEVAVEGSV